MEYKKISDTQMEQTIIKPQEEIKIVHDYDDLIKRRESAQAQADMYLAIVKDFDVLIAEAEKLGCKPKPVEEAVEEIIK